MISDQVRKQAYCLIRNEKWFLGLFVRVAKFIPWIHEHVIGSEEE